MCDNQLEEQNIIADNVKRLLGPENLYHKNGKDSEVKFVPLFNVFDIRITNYSL